MKTAYDEKTRKEHKTTVRGLMAAGHTTVREIQEQMQAIHGAEFDFYYLHNLMRKVQRDHKGIHIKLAQALVIFVDNISGF